MSILNIAAYKFTELDPHQLPELQKSHKTEADKLNLKGTILLSPEGINLFLAGLSQAIESFKIFLAQSPHFNDLQFKQSFSDTVPFKKLLVKIKKEIISFGIDSVKPHLHPAPYISPQQLKEWYESGEEMILLDTRNEYEITQGAFLDTIHLNIDNFREFPQAVQALPQEYKEKPIVTYCTGGIRAEKAAVYLLQQGFKQVYQLEGGILNYLEQCKNAYYQGDCFVFDERFTVNQHSASENEDVF